MILQLCPAIMDACRNDKCDILKELLEKGGDPNCKDHDNNTALYWSCFKGCTGCVRVLLSFGADVNMLACEKNNDTPLLTAIKHNHIGCLQVLLDKGASVAPPGDNYLDSPIEQAIFSDRPECLQALLEHGAGIERVDRFGSTPLHAAAKFGKLACVEVLLKFGADVSALDSENRTPCEIALQMGHTWSHEVFARATSIGSFPSSQIGYILSQNSSHADEVNQSTFVYCDISTVAVNHSQESTPFLSFMESSQLSNYSQQSQLGSQDLNPLQPPRYVRPNFEIDAADLEIGEQIGIGFYGKVYKGIWQRGTSVAVKRLTTVEGRIGEMTKKNFRLEMEMLMALRHPNIVLFLGASIQSPNLHLIMEYMPRGSLSQVLHEGYSGKTLATRTRIRMAMDVACGMNYLHKQVPEPILHRDLKSSNLLVTEDFRLKISDFGLARVKDGAFKPRNPLDITIQAPEVLRSRPVRYTEKSDIYSYGLLLWEVMCNACPFKDKEPKQIANDVLNKFRPPIPTSCNPTLSRLMSRCWDEDVGVRPTFQVIVNEIRNLLNQDADILNV